MLGPVDMSEREHPDHQCWVIAAAAMAMLNETEANLIARWGAAS